MPYRDDVSNAQIVADLLIRDGNVCMHPDCGKPFSEERPPTIDHLMPMAWCKINGWTVEQMHDYSNLSLMHRKCNSMKGDLIPNPDGTLPPRRNARITKAERPLYCVRCKSGRTIVPGEHCASCGSGAQPTTAPKVYQRAANRCDHTSIDQYCWLCFVGHVPRKGPLYSEALHAMQV